MLNDFLRAAEIFGLAVLPLLLLERLFPLSHSPRRYWQNAPSWALSFVAAFTWSRIGAWLTGGMYPLLKIRLWADSPWYQIALWTVAGLFAFDICFYWMHRAEHRWLWRFHRVHHSIRDLNCLNCFHHVAEGAIRIVFITLPLAFFFKVDAPSLFVVTVALTAWGYYIHADTRATLGPLRYVLADNIHHRVHHSTDKRHRDKNFAAFFPVIDMVFGTYLKPEPVAEIGIDGMPATRMIDLVR